MSRWIDVATVKIRVATYLFDKNQYAALQYLITVKPREALWQTLGVFPQAGLLHDNKLCFMPPLPTACA
jgi:hypothetical protein